MHRPIRSIYEKYKSHIESFGNDSIFFLVRQRSKVEKNLLLSKKIFWLKKSYGRTIRTMLSNNYDVHFIIDNIVREEGLKNIVFDLAS